MIPSSASWRIFSSTAWPDISSAYPPWQSPEIWETIFQTKPEQSNFSVVYLLHYRTLSLSIDKDDKWSKDDRDW